MCRLLAYLGSPIQPDKLIYEPEHSLYIQSYRPKETVTTSVNADGVGIGWYHSQKETEPFIYKNILPIWSDINLPHLSRYIESECFFAHIRSASPGQASGLSNCQPFSDRHFLFTHNGFIDDFRATLYQAIRNHVRDTVYQKIEGTTDSEHIFALFLNELATVDGDWEAALQATLNTLFKLTKPYGVKVLANIVISDGHQLIASRYAINTTPPSLYWLQNAPYFPNSVIIASEPLFPGNWNSFPESSMMRVEENLKINMQHLGRC
ncbi:MAG: ergothioneine biosynthesis protein EgtC [Symploca sp. SIO3E6]|nr:ergothioneine biosynthesis protein EgtC [Caldora sp. SIO3E6]